jgi:hypothetical protein
LISRQQALQAAKKEFRAGPALADPHYAPWKSASLGEPLLVSNVWKQPSYWLVPVERSERAIGFVRVTGTGRVSALGAYYRDPQQLESAPHTVTGIDSTEAARLASSHIAADQGESAGSPIYIHDGPPGREVWLVEVYKDGRPVRWLFVSSAGVYERPAGSLRDESLE